MLHVVVLSVLSCDSPESEMIKQSIKKKEYRKEEL